MNKGKVTKAILIGVFVPAIAIGAYYGGKWAIKQFKKSKKGENLDGDDSLDETPKAVKTVPKNPFSTEAELKDFQNYANKNGFSLVVDGIWGKNSSAAYDKLRESYAKNKIAVGDTGIINTLVTTVYDAKGGAWYKNDDEEAVYSSIKALGTKSNWVLFASAFKKKYNTTVIAYLDTFLQSTEKYTVNNLINKLK